MPPYTVAPQYPGSASVGSLATTAPTNRYAGGGQAAAGYSGGAAHPGSSPYMAAGGQYASRVRSPAHSNVSLQQQQYPQAQVS